MSEESRAGATVLPIDLAILFAEPGEGLVAEGDGLVILIDLGGIGPEVARLVVDALARQRRLRPRPAPIVNLTIVGERAPAPDAEGRERGRQMGEYMTAFVCVAEGTGVRARWVRAILASISAFSPRRVPVFTAPSIAEASAIAARELGIDASALAATVTALRARVAA